MKNNIKMKNSLNVRKDNKFHNLKLLFYTFLYIALPIK